LTFSVAPFFEKHQAIPRGCDWLHGVPVMTRLAAVAIPFEANRSRAPLSERRIAIR
jgi:hypothetical protein